VLPIGGLKEKVLAAHRAGLKVVILPKRNEKDLDDVPEEVRRDMQFILADRVEDVLAAALENPPAALKRQAVRKAPATGQPVPAGRRGLPSARKNKANGKR
jgi:ATP-dependent Lon protease